jgi:hypothetical protein
MSPIAIVWLRFLMGVMILGIAVILRGQFALPAIKAQLAETLKPLPHNLGMLGMPNPQRSKVVESRISFRAGRGADIHPLGFVSVLTCLPYE